MSKNVKVVCYVDTKDSTKGCLCAIPSDKDARKNDVIQKVADCIVESGLLAQFSAHAIDVAKAVIHHGFSNINEYEFGIEEVPLIEC